MLTTRASSRVSSLLDLSGRGKSMLFPFRNVVTLPVVVSKHGVLSTPDATRTQSLASLST